MKRFGFLIVVAFAVIGLMMSMQHCSKEKVVIDNTKKTSALAWQASFEAAGESAYFEWQKDGSFKDIESPEQSRADMAYFRELLTDDVKFFFKADEFKVHKFTHYGYAEKEIVQMWYSVPGVEEMQDIIFVDSTPGGKYSVNCKGSCDNSTDKCVEKINLLTGEVGCGCESDNCVMHIQE